MLRRGLNHGTGQKKAEPYDGWDGGGRNLTGHIAGHHLSGVSLMYRATGDARFKERADYLVKAYPEVVADRSLLEHVLSRLEVYPGRKQLANWRTLADAGDYAELARQVVERHYDPSYTRFSKQDDRPKLGTIALPMLDVDAQLEAAAQIVRMMRG